MNTVFPGEVGSYDNDERATIANTVGKMNLTLCDELCTDATLL